MDTLMGCQASGKGARRTGYSGKTSIENRICYYNTILAVPGALACNAAPPATPPRPTFTPQIKKWRSLLYSNLGASINFRLISLNPSNFSFAFPLRGKANESWTPQIKKRRSLLKSNMGAPINFC